MITNELLQHALTDNYPLARLGVNVWVGTPVGDNHQPLGDAEIMAWQVEGVEEPAPETLAKLCEPYKHEVACQVARTERNRLLSILDVVIGNPLRWADLTKRQQGALATYRQRLLDVPQQDDFPDKIKWPKAPKCL